MCLLQTILSYQPSWRLWNEPEKWKKEDFQSAILWFCDLCHYLQSRTLMKDPRREAKQLTYHQNNSRGIPGKDAASIKYLQSRIR